MYITTEKEYGPGSLLTFDAEAPGKATALTVDITPVQSGSGDPSPSNVRPISGWSEATLTRTSDSLYDPNTTEILNAYIGATTNAILAGNVEKTMIVYLPAGTYSVTKETDGGNNPKLAVCSFSDHPVIGSVGTPIIRVNGKSAVFTVSSDTWVAIWYYNGASADGNWEYCRPHTSLYLYYSVTFDLDGTRYGGTLDVLTGVLTVDSYLLELPTMTASNLNIYSSSYIKSDACDAAYVPTGAIAPYPRKGPDQQRYVPLCSVFPFSPNPIWNVTGYAGKFTINQNQIHMNFPNSLIGVTDYTTETVATVKTKICDYLNGLKNDGNPVSFWYKIAPQTIQLTAQQVTTLVGTNNVWANTGNTFLRVAEFLETGDSSTEQFKSYLEALRGDFTKLAKLEFLNPGGDVAFALDNNPLNKRSGAFLQSGSLSCNLQNGRRRQASVTLHNLDHAYEYAVEHIWFGQQIRLSEGLILPDGTEFYIPQGVFEIESPAEALKPGQRTVTYNLVDKWCNLDGTHFGNLEDVYSVTAGTNILAAVAALLKLDRFTAENNGANPIDPVAPLFTNYYNDKTQTLTDGTVVSLIEAPYDFMSASTGTYADVVLGLAEMIAGDVGYNQTGRLVINPSQDDIADQNKPILWEFTENDKTFLGADYSPKPADVYNDVIVVGATGDDNLTPRGRAQNLDPTSDTCVNRIGRKTIRLEMPNYYSDTICQDYAMWQLKRYSTMSKAVTVTCTQMFHIVENQLITIQRQDKPGSPIERHVVQGFTRPIGQTGTMTINCISTEDYPNATLVSSDQI